MSLEEFKLTKRRSKQNNESSKHVDVVHVDTNVLLEEIDNDEEIMKKERVKHDVLIDDKIEEDPFLKKDQEMLRLIEEQRKHAFEENAKAPKESKHETEKKRKQFHNLADSNNTSPTQEEIVATQHEEIQQLRLQLAEKAKHERDENEKKEQQQNLQEEKRVDEMLKAQQLQEQEQIDYNKLEVYNQQLHELTIARNAIKRRLDKTREDNEIIKEKERLRQNNTTPEELAKAKENNAIYKPNKGIKPLKSRRGIGVSKRH